MHANGIKAQCILLVGVASLLGAAACGTSAQKPSALQAPVPAQRGRGAGQTAVVCGELLTYAGVVGGKKRIFHVSDRFDYYPSEPTRTLYTHPIIPSYVDLLVLEAAPAVRRFLFAPDARVSFRGRVVEPYFAFDRWANAFRPSWVRLHLNTRGLVELAETQAQVIFGELRAVNRTSLVVRGRKDEQRSEGIRGSFDAEFNPRSFYAHDRLLCVPVGSNTHYTVNLDPVSLPALKAEIGRAVEIVQDCHGRARYVDVFRINDLFNFLSDEVDPLYYDKGTGGRWRGPLHRDAQGRWAFITNPPAWGGRPPWKLLWASPDVKIYDWYRFLIPIEQRPGPSYAGVWVDPESGMVTHVFWARSPDEE